MDGEKVIIYTDGSCTPNPGKGGWAALLTFKGVRKLVKGNSGNEQYTNNRAELMAMIIALEALKHPCEVEIISDSQYAVKMGNGEWMPKGNYDLIDRLHKQCDQHNVSFSWMREFTLPEQRIVHDASEYESGGIVHYSNKP